jgi:hypothetical protein
MAKRNRQQPAQLMSAMMTVALSSHCKDCGMDTTPCTGKRGRRHKERWEYYVVHDKLWARAGMKKGFLCVRCLEKRIGRRLRPKDFTDVSINDPENLWDTPRLNSRKRGM